MAKFDKVKENETGWSDDIFPKMKGYQMACCDCGLVHGLEFVAVKVTKELPDGSFEYKKLDTAKFRVIFKASRRNRSTGQMRRHMKTSPGAESSRQASGSDRRS